MLSKKELSEISDKIGEAVHNAWMDMRKKEKGWHNPDECIYNLQGAIEEDGKFCDNCHPCMKPYSELPESKKKLCRQYPEMFILVLDEMGYQIIKK